MDFALEQGRDVYAVPGNILEVNSMQSISAKEETSYIEIMEDNLELMRSVLS